MIEIGRTDHGSPVRKILLVVPSLGYGRTSKQFLLLAAGLPHLGFDVRVAVLEDGGGCARALRAQGTEVYELGRKRLFDLGTLRRLRRLFAAFRPDIVHAWSWASLRILAAAGTIRRGLLILSAVTPDERGSLWRQLDRWLLRGARLVVAAGPGEAEQCRQQGIPARKVVQVRPGVGPPALADTRDNLCRSLGIPPEARLILCLGLLVPGNGFQDAIWTFEILKYLFEDLHLLLIGDGPDRARLERFVRAVGAQGHVHFLGYYPDAAALLGHGELVWVPSRGHGGVNVALEAMAAGRPVVASRLPALAEIVQEGETGFLIDPGDKVALARRTRWLLENPRRCRQMGEAGKRRSELYFSAGQLVDRMACFYEEVTRTPREHREPEAPARALAGASGLQAGEALA
jgi:glycosyltransferase involved in cell wall biosynthesis